MEVEGYSAAARWVYGQALDPAEWSNDDLINLNEVRRIHFLATTPVWTVAPHPDAGSAESPGGFREHEIAAFDGGMKPPSWTEVPALLSDWIAEVLATGELVTTGTNSDVPLPEQLAKLHHSFECLRQAAQRGRLDATQGSDGIWRSSRTTVSEYAAIEHTRRRRAT